MPVAHGEDLQRGPLSLHVRPEHVPLLEVGGGDLLRRLQPLQRPHLVAQAGRLLEALLAGRFLHGGLQPAQHLVGAPFQEQPGVFAGLAVALQGADLGHAGRQAPLDLVLQARPRPVAVQDLLAGAHAEDLVHHARGLASQAGRDVGPAVGVLVLSRPAHHVEPGVLLAQGQLQVGMVLVVAEEDVVAGLVPLDEVVLEGQRLHLAVRHHQLEVRDLVAQRVQPRVHGPGGLEVLAHPVAQRARLAHVEDLARRVAEHVHPGAGG